MDNLIDRLSLGDWVHTFPTGRREPEGQLGVLRPGLGRLIIEPVVTPLVVPFYHSGMTQVLDRKKGDRVPVALGRKLRIEVGDPMDFSELVAECRRNGGDEAALREEVLRRVDAEMRRLQQRCVDSGDGIPIDVVPAAE
jgi:monolysocardiolipin acyltransferase